MRRRAPGTGLDRELDIVSRTVPHDSAHGHVTGGAPYIDDLSALSDELQVSFVGSPVARGELVSVDSARAREVEGVVCVLEASDIPGHNLFGPIFEDEPFLASKHVEYVGQPVVVIAAETREALELARTLVEVEVRGETPVLSIEDAVDQRNFLGPRRSIRRGDPGPAITESSESLAGSFRVGGQEQFYLESQAALAYPLDGGGVRVVSSTQNPTEVQAVLAEVLGLGQHQVVCECTRMGGAFGGKETQASLPALMAGLVVLRTGRSARVIYGKDDDMRVTGKRHEMRADWQVGFRQDGRIGGLEVTFYSNGGAFADLSTSVMERSLLHIDNAYFLEHVEVVGKVCKTNLPPNTAFRGFGGPQAVAVIENIVEEIALHLDLDPFEVRRTNLYGCGERSSTHYGQVFDENQLALLMESLVESSSYRERRAEALASGSSRNGPLRGVGIVPVKFGISFTSRFLNQGNALVNVYADGTVQVSTGGTEMGQGLNIKIQQLVAEEMGVKLESVKVMTTSTEKNNNTSPTAASAGTDLNGTAAIRACEVLRDRLSTFAAQRLAEPHLGLSESPESVRFQDGEVFDERAPERRMTFATLANQARRERIDLGARGFYATPGVDFNRETGRGSPFLYFTQGAAVAEVVVDRFTGMVKVVGSDLLLDIGRSLNPGVDRGQVVGGYVQGMGWVTAEQLVYDEGGELLSHSPTTYKVPGVRDIPSRFVVDFLENRANTRNLYCSKAVGEPPLLLAIAVWTAVKQAVAGFSIEAARALRLPATGEEVLRCLELGRDESPSRDGSKAPVGQTVEGTER